MALADASYGELKQKMIEAVEVEAHQIDELRREVKKLIVRKLGYRPCKTIAPLATDGGENRLTFEPLNLEIIRVVDSKGETDVLDQIEDTSNENEVVYIYKRQGSAGTAHVRGARNLSGWYAIGEYVWMPAVNGQELRDNPTWQQWATSQAEKER